MTIALYRRVSSATQDTRSQEAELKKWAEAQDESVCWYADTFTGTTLQRPGIDKLLADVRSGKITKVVVWRLDRLGRTARGLHDFLAELTQRRVGFLSLRDSFDLGTSAGRLMFGVLASVAQYETEVRGERQRAGIHKVREQNGGKCPWGGRKPGTRVRVTEDKERAIYTMHALKQSVAGISRVVGLSRKTVYEVLRKNRPGQ